MIGKICSLPLLFIAGTAGASEINAFFTDSEYDITLRNVWMLNTSDSLSEHDVGTQNAWAQGLHLNYRSGWLADTLGVDASWYNVTKLYANRSFAGRDLVRDNNGHAEGLSKVGQLYGKARWGDNDRYARLYAGWKQLSKVGMINITRGRAIPDTWEGISAETGWDTFALNGAWVTRFSERDEPEKKRFFTLQSNKPIDYIATGDVSWNPSTGNYIRYAFGQSQNYLRRQGIEAAARLPLNADSHLILRGAGYLNQGLDNWEGTRGFTDTARHLFLLTGYQHKNVESGVGWSTTKAPLKNGLGHFYWHLGKNTRGFINSAADGEGNDYVNDGEQMVYAWAQHQLTPAFKYGIFGNYGWDAKYQGVALKEWEFGGFFSWSPEAIDNLNLFAGFGPSYSWKMLNGKPWLTEDKRTFHRAKGVGGTVAIEYRFGNSNQGAI
ncbi:OprD family outer membrane porin [Erwinia oleae]|uniref:OprD family outer membrane porin n=1 Tax=Erwinia oleae TaxID=796334 RepID=UPI0005500143|nr:OprD family outer membrane porin [Erwinia oleae]